MLEMQREPQTRCRRRGSEKVVVRCDVSELYVDSFGHVSSYRHCVDGSFESFQQCR